MTTLIVTLADVETVPLGPGSQTADVEVGVAYDRDVHLVDGSVVPAGVQRVKTIADSAVPLTFEVLPADSAAVAPGSHNFATIVTATIRPRTREGGGRPTMWARTVQVREADGATVKLGDLDAAQLVPQPWVTVAQLVDTFRDAGVATAGSVLREAFEQATQLGADLIASADAAAARNLLDAAQAGAPDPHAATHRVGGTDQISLAAEQVEAGWMKQMRYYFQHASNPTAYLSAVADVAYVNGSLGITKDLVMLGPKIGPGNLGTGTPTALNVLHGDGVWRAVSGLTADQLAASPSPGASLQVDPNGDPEWVPPPTPPTPPASTYVEGIWASGATDGLGGTTPSRYGSATIIGDLVIVNIDFQRTTVSNPNNVLTLPTNVPTPVRRFDAGATAYAHADGGCQVYIEPGTRLLKANCRAGIRYIGQLIYSTR